MKRYDFFKTTFNFLHSLTNPSPDEEREIDLGAFIDEEEGDIDGETDVELDGNNLLDLDLDSEHNDDLESDLLSDSEDRAGSAEEFQWSPTFPEQVLSLRILIYFTPPHQFSLLNFS